MRERLTTILAALGTLALLVALLGPGEGDDESSRPVSDDRGNAGLWALQAWAAGASVPTARLLEPYEALGLSGEWPLKGNLLVVVLPQRESPDPQDLADLRNWVELGNDVLLLAVDGDLRRWLLRRDPGSTWSVLDAFGLSLESEEDDTEAADLGELLLGERSAFDRAHLALTPLAPLPLLDGVREVTVAQLPLAERPKSLEAAQDDVAVGVLAAPDGAGSLWMLPRGDGRIWLSRHGSMFFNEHLGRTDNARLASNLIAAALAPGGRLIFDDMHQGVSALYDPQALVEDPRLWISIAFALTVWFAWVAGRAQRLAPFRAAPTAPRTTDFALALAGLLARRMTPQATAGALLDHFFAELRERYRLPPDAAHDWPLLERVSSDSGERIERLRAQARRLQRGQRVDPRRLLHLLTGLRETLR